MKIRVERSGGFGGLQISNEVNSKDLPSALLSKVKKIMLNKKSPALPSKALPLGAADYFTYKISINDGANQRIIECNQCDIGDDLKSIIKYVERNSKVK